nr:MAG TPA: hypothetical protein [Caudoviricetes sp.]
MREVLTFYRLLNLLLYIDYNFSRNMSSKLFIKFILACL